MSEKYKTTEDGLSFVSFSVVGWLDVFIRRQYQDILVDSIIYCQIQKSLKIFAYCIMPSHVHFITYLKDRSLSNVLRDLKSFTANKIIDAIQNNIQESRKELLIEQFINYGTLSPQKQKHQFWKHDNHPFYLHGNPMIKQKVDYIHNNPVDAGFVDFPYQWRLSSANENSAVKLDKL